jgi:hypothetical protein
MARSSSCRHFRRRRPNFVARVSASLSNGVVAPREMSLCLSHFNALAEKWKIQKKKARAGERPGLLRGGQGKIF